MILDDIIVKLSEDIFVVIDELEELTSDGSEIILADGEARWNLQK